MLGRAPSSQIRWMSHSKSSHIVGFLQSCSTYVDQDMQLVLVLHRKKFLVKTQ
jgi:hypothetical protein